MTDTMKELLADRLGKIEDLEQRRLLKQVLASVFLPLAEHQEHMYRQLEERVFREVVPAEEPFAVYAALGSRDGYDPTDEFLYPMRLEDVAAAGERLPDAGQLAEAYAQGVPYTLQFFYMNCRFGQLQELLASRRPFRGELITAEGPYPITVQLRPYTAYVQEIEKLHRLFRLNGIPWRTVHHPYAFRFAEAVLLDCERLPDASAPITGVRIDLEEYEPFKRPDRIPLWNIGRHVLRSAGFPMPALDRIHYEHVLPLRKLGGRHGYLVEAEDGELRYVRREPQELVVTAPQEKAGSWTVWRVAQPEEGAPPPAGKREGIVSNRLKPSFLAHYELKQSALVRSPGEIRRILHAFEASEGLAVEEVRGFPAGMGGPQLHSSLPAIRMNPFRSDSWLGERDRMRLHITFKAADAATASAAASASREEDAIHFLLSEVERLFPDYLVTGERV